VPSLLHEGAIGAKDLLPGAPLQSQLMLQQTVQALNWIVPE
jgi:hypothetical protein